MRAIGDQVAKNPEYLSILEKEAIKNGKIDDKTQVEQVSVMNKLLNDALRDEILNALGHEFGHYSKEDNKTGTQTIANYSGKKLEDRTKGIVSKEATEDTLAAIRNNKNVITGEEGKKLADSIPMERREYKGYGISVGFSFSTPRGGGGGSLMEMYIFHKLWRVEQDGLQIFHLK